MIEGKCRYPEQELCFLLKTPCAGDGAFSRLCSRQPGTAYGSEVAFSADELWGLLDASLCAYRKLDVSKAASVEAFQVFARLEKDKVGGSLRPCGCSQIWVRQGP